MARYHFSAQEWQQQAKAVQEERDRIGYAWAATLATFFSLAIVYYLVINAKDIWNATKETLGFSRKETSPSTDVLTKEKVMTREAFKDALQKEVAEYTEGKKVTLFPRSGKAIICSSKQIEQLMKDYENQSYGAKAPVTQETVEGFIPFAYRRCTSVGKGVKEAVDRSEGQPIPRNPEHVKKPNPNGEVRYR